MSHPKMFGVTHAVYVSPGNTSGGAAKSTDGFHNEPCTFVLRSD